MKSVLGIARISNADGAPAAGLQLRMQSFSLKTGKWINVASGATGDDGNISLSGPLEEDDDDGAPQLRLVRAPANAVLSEGGRLSYNRDTGELAIEFGDLVDLGDPVSPVAVDVRFARINHTIAAQPASIRTNAATGMRVAARGVGADLQRAELNAATLRPQLDLLNVQLATRDKEITELRSNLQSRDNVALQLQQKVQQIPQLEAQIAGLRVVERDLATERGRAVDLGRQLEQVRKENEQLKAPQAQTVSTQAVAENLGRQIRQAQVAIGAEAGGLALANVRVKIKGVAANGAQTVQFLGKDDLEKTDMHGGLAEFDFEFGQQGTPAPVDDVVVPALRGLTESAVRQVLVALGLRLSPVSGPADGGVAPGQAVMQAPAAGTRAARGATITVVFAG